MSKVYGFYYSRKVIADHKTDTYAGRKAIGKALRKDVPLSSHGDWSPAANRPDPLDLLQAQDEGRLEHLLPIKYGRMMASSFGFLRGSAAVMTADLANTPTTGINVILCGDAHLSNFGIYASPERRLIFDLNDFDEAFFGPWEWDLKRLAASGVVAGRENGFSDQWCYLMALHVAQTYSIAMRQFAHMSTMERWYYHTDVETLLTMFEGSSIQGQKHVAKMIAKAQSHTHEQTLEKMTEVVKGQRRIVSNPPLLVPFREQEASVFLTEEFNEQYVRELLDVAWTQYLESVTDERTFLLRRYKIIDAALRVGGVGSVGTRCLVVLLEGEVSNDCLILQLKEAGPSVLEPYASKRSPYDNHAQRVVTGQQLLQATNDIFLGWARSKSTGNDFYWRQLKDMKGSANVAAMDEKGLKTYLAVCSWCLARAHARTGSPIKITGYLGKRKYAFAEAIANFATAYADQTQRDYEKLVKAVKSGRIKAEMGI